MPLVRGCEEPNLLDHLQAATCVFLDIKLTHGSFPNKVILGSRIYYVVDAGDTQSDAISHERITKR